MEKTIIISNEDLDTMDQQIVNNLKDDQYIKITGLIRSTNLIKRGLRIRVKVVNIELLGNGKTSKETLV